MADQDPADGRQDRPGHRRHRRNRQGHCGRAGRAGRPGRHHRPGPRAGPRRPRPTSVGRPATPPWTVFVADMSSQAEVRRLAAEVLDAYPRLDVLVNNVGGFWATRHVTADGLEHTFALNHLAPFLLTNLLLERLQSQRTGPGRDRLVRRPGDGADRLRRPAGRARLLGASERTTSPSWPTSCSPTSWPAGWRAPASPPPCFTPASFAPASAPRTRRACTAC